MYSRNINRKPMPSRPMAANDLNRPSKEGDSNGINGKDSDKNYAQSQNRSIAVKKQAREADAISNSMPVPPPNYRGMIYDIEEITEKAEGIDRLVRNDPSYIENENKKKRREVAERAKGRGAEAFSHVKQNETAQDPKENSRAADGIKRIAEGMRENSFSPEDVLICALILIMLNSKSEDDILMVLVLMMLL